MKDSKGLTLIELLAVLALSGLVMLLIVSFFLFGSRNFSHQNDQTAVVSNARYSMDYLTRQIRKATELEVNEDGDILVIDSSEIKLEDHSLYHDNYEIASGIDNFMVSKNGNEVQIEIMIIDSNAQEYKLSSIVNLRRGGSYENEIQE